VSEELKPCPFCQEDDVRNRYYPAINRGGLKTPEGYSLKCFPCGIETAIYPTLEEVTEFWNNRAAQPEAAMGGVESIGKCPRCQKDIPLGHPCFMDMEGEEILSCMACERVKPFSPHSAPAPQAQDDTLADKADV